jgi:hypothetical protein
MRIASLILSDYYLAPGGTFQDRGVLNSGKGSALNFLAVGELQQCFPVFHRRAMAPFRQYAAFLSGAPRKSDTG